MKWSPRKMLLATLAAYHMGACTPVDDVDAPFSHVWATGPGFVHVDGVRASGRFDVHEVSTRDGETVVTLLLPTDNGDLAMTQVRVGHTGPVPICRGFLKDGGFQATTEAVVDEPVTVARAIGANHLEVRFHHTAENAFGERAAASGAVLLRRRP